MTQEKDFVRGKSVVKTFSNGGSILNISIPVEELKRIENNGWVNISICKMREPKGDKTHYMVNNAFVKQERMPEQHDQEQPQSGHVNDFPIPAGNDNFPNNDEIKIENIPF